jgi:hypothetical protein
MILINNQYFLYSFELTDKVLISAKSVAYVIITLVVLTNSSKTLTNLAQTVGPPGLFKGLSVWKNPS